MPAGPIGASQDRHIRGDRAGCREQFGTIYEGTSNMQLQTIAKNLLK